MIDTFRRNVTINRLRKDADNIDISKGKTYYISYPVFVEYLKNLETLTEHNIILAANFTYGWMPTTLRFQSDKINEVAVNLNSVKRGEILTQSELNVLKCFFNNSMVGTSKLLHFINPNQYLIWDNRVYRYLTNSTPHHYKLDKCDTYLEYMVFCAEVISQKEYEPIHSYVITKVGYPMTPFRTIELIMYANGVKVKKQ